MIGYLSGRVIGHLDDQVLLKLPSGVGYLVHVSPAKVYHVNENLEFFIWEVARDDKSELYGFETMDDRQWVEKLTKVSGVGPKAAANIIYSIGWSKVVEAINTTDAAIFTTVKGLGSKTAKKIVLELKGSTTDLTSLQSSDPTVGQMAIDFTDTLANLGYKRGEIVSTISRLKKEGYWEEGDLMATVKRGLELLGRK